jgi:5,10-methylenetetrahydromethanopterin reductase
MIATLSGKGRVSNRCQRSISLVSHRVRLAFKSAWGEHPQLELKLALGFNPVIPVREAVRLGQKAERENYDSVWFHESLYQRDVVSYLASIILSTNTLKLGSGVVNTFTRHPVTVAATFASLAELSMNRVMLGVGLGSFPTIPKIGYKIFPVGETKPLRRIKEYATLVRKLWAGELVNARGEFFTAQGLQLDVKFDFKIPLYIASLSHKTLSYAGGHADGAILSPALNTVETTSKMVEWVKEGEKSNGKTIEKASYILTSVDPDPKKARDTVRGFYFFLYQLAEVIGKEDLERCGMNSGLMETLRDAWKRGNVGEAKGLVPDSAINALALSGTAEEAKEKLTKYMQAGVTLPILMPIGNVDYAVEAMSPRLWK